MSAPVPTGVPSRNGKILWAARLRRFGQRGVTLVLLGIGALWAHELCVDPNVRQGWKLYVLMVLVPLGVLASLSLGVAWVLQRAAGDKR